MADQYDAYDGSAVQNDNEDALELPEHDDPFQLRIHFNQRLVKLHPSAESLARTASFVTRWAYHDDVLHSVLLERMAAAPPAQRLALFCLLDHILLTSLRAGIGRYRNRIARDLPGCVLTACPTDSSFGRANAATVRQIVAGWRRKRLLDGAPVPVNWAAVDQALAEIASTSAQVDLAAVAAAAAAEAAASGPRIPSQPPPLPRSELTEGSVNSLATFPGAEDGEEAESPPSKLDSNFGAETGSSAATAQSRAERKAARMARHEILTRMEDDRDRHKRAREDCWIRPPYEDLERQFDAAWEATPPLCPADLERMERDAVHWLELCRPSWIVKPIVLSAPPFPGAM
ncbi:CTD kinase subunit gamma CTK3-domain-containing protein [Blastocladiella britannica]|nr:CTD kinase subunit gamma CTK3-domain-containing protein [Blastocladiella britannica]